MQPRESDSHAAENCNGLTGVKPYLAMQLLTLALAALLILNVNWRLDRPEIRGTPSLDGFAIGLLVVMGLVDVVASRLRTPALPYLTSVATAFIVFVAYIMGTARFD